MVRYGITIALLLAWEAVAYTNYGCSTTRALISSSHYRRRRSFSDTRSCVSASPDFSSSDEPNGMSDLDAFSGMASSYVESISSAMLDEEDSVEVELDRKRKRVQQRKSVGSYQMTLSLQESLGFTLAQIDTGRKISDVELNLETMKIGAPSSTDSESEAASSVQRMDVSTVKELLEPSFQGLIVASVDQAGQAWRDGVRPGDLLASVSATLGGSRWPKSTLEGVKAAISSRKVVSGTVALEFKRIAEQMDNLFELTLTRPLGFQIQETEDGYVEVTGISESAPTLVRYAIQVGDRVVAVESSLGGQMWPVSTVEGVISACTSRLPGKPVTIRFERPEADLSGTATIELPKPATKTAQAPVVVEQAPDKKQLISRCREVLRRYAGEESKQNVRSSLTALPVLVADKVVDALASASTAIDSITLSMIMNAYLSCGQPEGVIRVFEAAVGLSADGSANPATQVVEGKKGGALVPNESALNLYTATSLLQAHALRNDIASVSRVLAALEGRSGIVIGGSESAPWPWTGTYGSIQADTQCYNIAISAAEKVGGPEAVEMALSLFDMMSEPGKQVSNDRRPQKDIVTYNTLISALSNARRPNEAFNLFEQMKRAGIRPDKYTYTSLIKACGNDDDVQEILYDMKDRGIKADVVTYNTMIRSLCEKRKWTQATRLVTEMESRGISPDSRTYGFLMNAMLKADKPSACLTLFESACANERTASLTQNVHLYTTAITAAAVIGDYERALDFVKRMNANGVKPNLKTLTAVMGACLSAGKPDIAAQLYRRMEKPDGYAMSQGIQALCGSGDLTGASAVIKSQRRGRRLMSGKQIMASYNAILQAALQQNDFAVARDIFADLLKQGNIPSKTILYSIVDSLGLGLAKKDADMEDSEEDMSAFGYLLFLLDSVQQRNLPIDGILYAAILTLGSRIGGIPRKIASLLADARTSGKAGTKEILSTQGSGKELLIQRWEDLLSSYDTFDLHDLPIERLPSLPVRVASRDVRRVLRAEQSVGHTSRSRQSSRNKGRKQRASQ